VKLLALDTSTQACSVAIWLDGQAVEVLEIASNRHSSLILTMVDQVLAESGTRLNQCDAIAFSRGPGSFTGLRIGVGVVQGLAYGADVPVLPISSLRAQAARAGARAENVLAAFDARMRQVYWGLYRLNTDGYAQADNDIMLTAPELVRVPGAKKWLAAGGGCDLYREIIEAANTGAEISFIPRSYPHAIDVARLGAIDYRAGRAVPAALALPEYVRNQVTT